MLVSGMVAGVPGQGGATWAVLQYVLGLRRLGCDVVLVEPVDEITDESIAYLRELVAWCGLGDSVALLREGTHDTAGLSYDGLRRFARRADVLLNISGMLSDEALRDPIPVRVYLDLDPAFNQLWQAVCGIDMRFDGHTHFVTVGQAIGEPTCRVPTCGRTWLPTLQPVVLEHWRFADGAAPRAVTTVANWRGYGSIEHDGLHFGQKAHSMRRIIDLPRRTSESLLLALAIASEEVQDLAALAHHGWKLARPADVAATPAAFRRFVQASKAELGVAKSGYVVSRCGWFSDRSACYLASGRPVVAEDTGFGRYLPTGAGLFAFTGGEDAAAALDALRDDYAFHRHAARALAEEHFDSDRVLTRLLDRVADG